MIPLQRLSKGLLEFLFPPETDRWVAVLRIGLGLQVTIYALFLKSDWHYLFANTGKGLVSRELGEAITSFDSPLIPKLGWLVALGGYAHIGEDAVLSIAWACLLCMGLLAFSLARPQSPRGFFTSAQLKAVGYSHTELITS
jgi:hypothetical protein